MPFLDQISDAGALAVGLAGAATVTITVAAFLRMRRCRLSPLDRATHPWSIVGDIVRASRACRRLGLSALAPLSERVRDPGLAIIFRHLADGVSDRELEAILADDLDRRLAELEGPPRPRLSRALTVLRSGLAVAALLGGSAAIVWGLGQPERFAGAGALAVFLTICAGCAALAQERASRPADPVEVGQGALVHVLISAGAIGLLRAERPDVLKAQLESYLRPGSAEREDRLAA